MPESIGDRPLFVKEYRTAVAVRGPLVMVERVGEAGYNELAELANGERPAGDGQVLEVDRDRATLQAFAGTRGLSLDGVRVRFKHDVPRLGVALTMLLDPAIPFTSGTWRHVDVAAPPGSVVSAVPPEARR